MKRVATALILIPAFTWIILASPPAVFLAALAVVALVAFYEYDQIASSHNIAPAGLPGMAVGLALLFAPEPGIVAVFVALTGMAFALRTRDVANAMATASSFTLGVIYIFGSWRCAGELRAMNPRWLMFAMIICWVGDTAAYYVGRSFGRHKMAPQISPAKSWEGAAGSLFGGVLAGTVYASYLLPGVPIGTVLALAAAGNIAGQLGDLCESALKRGAGVKDSGSLLPGHGGWLDRIDASLFSVPAVYVLLRLAAQIR